jgi:cold shock protein
MLTGKVVRFDEIRGFGFIAPDKGGEDVFVHANSLDDDKTLFVPGLPVEFEVVEGDRGLKAYAVHIIHDHNGTAAPRPGASQAAMSAMARVATSAPPEDDLASPAGPASPAAEDVEDLCDVLTASAFRSELIDLLLDSGQTLTASQINELVRGLVDLGKQHGWVEN